MYSSPGCDWAERCLLRYHQSSPNNLPITYRCSIHTEYDFAGMLMPQNSVDNQFCLRPFFDERRFPFVFGVLEHCHQTSLDPKVTSLGVRSSFFVECHSSATSDWEFADYLFHRPSYFDSGTSCSTICSLICSRIPFVDWVDLTLPPNSLVRTIRNPVGSRVTVRWMPLLRDEVWCNRFSLDKDETKLDFFNYTMISDHINTSERNRGMDIHQLKQRWSGKKLVTLGNEYIKSKDEIAARKVFEDAKEITNRHCYWVSRTLRWIESKRTKMNKDKPELTWTGYANKLARNDLNQLRGLALTRLCILQTNRNSKGKKEWRLHTIMPQGLITTDGLPESERTDGGTTYQRIAKWRFGIQCDRKMQEIITQRKQRNTLQSIMTW